MARNAHDGALAFQAAESALRQAEQFLAATPPDVAAFTDTGTNGLWTAADFGDPPRWADPAVWTGSSSLEISDAIVGVSQQPRYMIEFVSEIERVENENSISEQIVKTFHVFRITALGVGGSDNARVLLQSSFGLNADGA